MHIKYLRRVRDNLHGSTDISYIEDKVISHPVVQRLRRIRQTAFLNFVFPGASHSRFEHSLGVMHLAGSSWQKLYENQKRLEESCRSFPKFDSREKEHQKSSNNACLSPTFKIMEDIFASDYIFQAFRLAALLHDVGHPPFSHSGEKFLPSLYSILRDNQLPNYLKDYFEQNLQGNPEKKANHETFTLILVEKILKEVAEASEENTLTIDPRDVVAILNPNIQPERDSLLSQYSVYKLCHELLSGDVDIDRMDYLQRDSRECGVVYGIFDLGRVLDNLAIYYSLEDHAPHLAIHYSGLAAFEDYLRARQSMYLQVYFHKTSVVCEAMLQELLDQLQGCHLPSNCAEYVRLDESNFKEFASKQAFKLFGESKEFTNITTLVEDLLELRRLWKNVFEVSYNPEDETCLEDLATAEKLLQAANIPYQKISSKNSLTKFRGQKSNPSTSEQPLRLIKKDNWQFPRVIALEEFSPLYRGEKLVQITRLYVPGSGNKNSPNFAEQAKRVLFQKFS